MDIELHNHSHPTMKENYHYDNYSLPLERLVKKIIAIELPAPKKQKLIIRKKKIKLIKKLITPGKDFNEL